MHAMNKQVLQENRELKQKVTDLRKSKEIGESKL